MSSDDARGGSSARRVLRSGADRLLRPLQARLDVISGKIDARSDRVEGELARLAGEVARVASQVAAQAERLDALERRVSDTARDLTRMAGEQVDGANDANEALGRVLDDLRSEIRGLTEAAGAAPPAPGDRRP